MCDGLRESETERVDVIKNVLVNVTSPETLILMLWEELPICAEGEPVDVAVIITVRVSVPSKDCDGDPVGVGVGGSEILGEAVGDISAVCVARVSTVSEAEGNTESEPLLFVGDSLVSENVNDQIGLEDDVAVGIGWML